MKDHELMGIAKMQYSYILDKIAEVTAYSVVEPVTSAVSSMELVLPLWSKMDQKKALLELTKRLKNKLIEIRNDANNFDPHGNHDIFYEPFLELCDRLKVKIAAHE